MYLIVKYKRRGWENIPVNRYKKHGTGRKKRGGKRSECIEYEIAGQKDKNMMREEYKSKEVRRKVCEARVEG